VLVLASSAARADTVPACRRAADGSVTCDADGFARLTRAVLEARARADICTVDLTSTQAALADRKRDLELCEATAPCDDQPAPSRVVPLLGLAAGVVGALAMGAAATSIALTGSVQPVPAVVAAAGLGLTVAGTVLVAW